MSNPSKKKGTAAESAVVKYLHSEGYGGAERLQLAGYHDRGDIRVCEGVILEVKAGNAAANASPGQIDAWLQETEKERVAAGADLGFLIRKRGNVGLGRINEWAAHFRLEQFARMIRREMLGDPDDPIATSVEFAIRQMRAYYWGVKPTGPHYVRISLNSGVWQGLCSECPWKCTAPLRKPVEHAGQGHEREIKRLLEVA